MQNKYGFSESVFKRELERKEGENAEKMNELKVENSLLKQEKQTYTQALCRLRFCSIMMFLYGFFSATTYLSSFIIRLQQSSAENLSSSQPLSVYEFADKSITLLPQDESSDKYSNFQDIGHEDDESENLKCLVQSSNVEFDDFHLRYIHETERQLFEFNSQMDEDFFVFNTFLYRGGFAITGGTYWEIGAYQGILISNTYFFEKYLEWSGYLVEAGDFCKTHVIPNRGNSGKNNIICKAICPEGQSTVEFIDNIGMGGIVYRNDEEVMEHMEKYSSDKLMDHDMRPCTNFKEVFDQYPTTQIDFLSLDIEGGELNFLKLFPFDRVKVGLFVIERHHRLATVQFMQAQGYCFRGRERGNLIFYHPDWKAKLDKAFDEMIFPKNDLPMEPFRNEVEI